MRELIPGPVFESIQRHLRNVGAKAAQGWESNEAEEDSLTGDLGRLLKTPHAVNIRIGDQAWRWSIGYKKFRGRGPDAFESIIGADGIIQIETTLRDSTFFKGV